MPTLQQLTRKHPDYSQSLNRGNYQQTLQAWQYWQLLDCLVNGGSKLNWDAREALLANPDNRPKQVIQERLKVSRYLNQIGPIVNRYLAQLFQNEAVYEGSKDAFWKDKFIPAGAVLDGDDDAKCSFHNFLRESMLQSLIQGKAIAWVDVPPSEARNRKQQQEDGGLDPYVMLIPRWDLWDYDTDKQGFRFTKIHRFKWVRDNWDGDPVAQHTFTIHQRKDGKVYASRYTVSVKLDKGFDDPLAPYRLQLATADPKSTDIKVDFEDKVIFNVKGKFEFPVITMSLPPVLWVADQLYDAQAEHFNQTSALSWALITSNYAMPAITSDDPDSFWQRNSQWGQGFYLSLATGESVNWLERPSGAFDTSMQYLEAIENGITKTMQQIALSADQTMPQVSGEAIRQAKQPEVILLENYGQRVIEYATSILNCAAIAHDEDVQWNVTGFSDFTVENLQIATQEFQGVMQANIPSETFKREYYKSFARNVCQQSEIDGSKVKVIMKEIDAADLTPPAPGQPGEMPQVGQSKTPDQPEQPDDQGQDGEDWQKGIIDEALG